MKKTMILLLSLLMLSAAVAVAGEAPEDGFVSITGGTFDMGSPEDEPWRGEDETLRSVTVGDFFISPYEVTQAEYEALTDANPSAFKAATCL